MKRTISAVIAALLLTVTLAGCNKDGNSSDSSTPDNSVSDNSSDNTSENSSDNSSESSDNSSDTSTSTNDSSSSESNPESKPDESKPEESKPEESQPTESQPPVSNKTAEDYVNAALSTDEWGGMDFLGRAEMEIMSEDLLEVFLHGLDLDLVSDFCIASSSIGINPYKVAVMKPKAGGENAVKEFMQTELENIQAQDWYPPTEPFAKGSVTGVTTDGYYYFICHKNGAAVASYMIANA